jgi:uncharacterized Zn finger protein
MNARVEIPALAAERRETVRRIIALEAVAFAGLLARKKPEQIDRLQTQILSLRARVRSLDQQISYA